MDTQEYESDACILELTQRAGCLVIAGLACEGLGAPHLGVSVPASACCVGAQCGYTSHLRAAPESYTQPAQGNGRWENLSSLPGPLSLWMASCHKVLCYKVDPEGPVMGLGGGHWADVWTLQGFSGSSEVRLTEERPTAC